MTARRLLIALLVGCAIVAGTAQSAAAALDVPACGRAKFKSQTTGHWAAWGGWYRYGNTGSCKTARRVLRDLLAGKGRYRANSKYAFDDEWLLRGWTCGGHTGTIGCTRGRQHVMAELVDGP